MQLVKIALTYIVVAYIIAALCAARHCNMGWLADEWDNNNAEKAYEVILCSIIFVIFCTFFIVIFGIG